MSNIALVLINSFRYNLRMRAAFFISMAIIFICVVGVIVIFSVLIINPEMEKPVPDISALENAMGLVLFSASFITIGIYSGVFSIQSMIREKARGNIQALLATPLTPGDIWLGKSLAVFLPGLVFTIILTIAAFLAINLIYFTGTTGFIATPWMFISNLIASPLLYFSVVLFLYIVGLTGKAGTANIITQIFLPVMANVMIQLGIRTSLGAGSWLFMLILIGTAVVIGIGSLSIRSRLITENIIMSLQG
jgi:ABC-2 type transport system permease protein